MSDHGGKAPLGADPAIERFDMRFYRIDADIQNGCDILIGFSLNNPRGYFKLTRAQLWKRNAQSIDWREFGQRALLHLTIAANDMRTKSDQPITLKVAKSGAPDHSEPGDVDDIIVMRNDHFHDPSRSRWQEDLFYDRKVEIGLVIEKI